MNPRPVSCRTRSAVGLIGAALAATALAGSLITPAQADSNVTKTRLFGEAAIAEFQVIEECKSTRVEVFANSNAVTGASIDDEFGIVAVSIVDTCANVLVVEGFGQTTDIDLLVDNSLARADLKMSLPIANFVNATVTPLTLDLDLSATARRVKTMARDRFESDGVVFKSSSATATRQAEATGTVVYGTEEIVGAGDVSRSASINKAKTTETTRDRLRP